MLLAEAGERPSDLDRDIPSLMCVPGQAEKSQSQPTSALVPIIDMRLVDRNGP